MGILSWLFGRRDGTSETEETMPPLAFDTPLSRARGPKSESSPRVQIQWRDRSFPMEVVGESNYQKALIEICGPHNRYGHDQEQPAAIELEPSNPHDANAVVVKIFGRVVGYLPREQAKRVGLQMREEGLRSAVCSSRVQGGWRTNQYDEGHFGVRLAIPTRGWIDFGTGRSPPATATSAGKPNRPEPARSGPLRGEWVTIIGAASNGDLAKDLAGKGAHIMAGVGKSTSLLVVAEERPFSSGLVSSTQYRRAEQRISEGSSLRIVSLSEARQLMAR